MRDWYRCSCCRQVLQALQAMHSSARQQASLFNHRMLHSASQTRRCAAGAADGAAKSGHLSLTPEPQHGLVCELEGGRSATLHRGCPMRLQPDTCLHPELCQRVLSVIASNYVKNMCQCAQWGQVCPCSACTESKQCLSPLL